ncbi:Uu.00g114430.m01.CDS01 [Anthostomella pinea]|uniref:Uu.00g114430.m01.CDS01 n=1 Tax=Anthostomella pinea TaxID=933095 RepID=A0AAI8YGM5_9PEZI|nr:Uu.00g114430.m01.CDS01 [Anthostomella pinea]
MSDHPYPRGQFAPSQQPPPSSTHQPVLPNAPIPYLGNPNTGGVAPNNYAAINSSFQYNANRIPGLGLGGPSVSSTPNRFENISWHALAQVPDPNTFPPPSQERTLGVDPKQPTQQDHTLGRNQVASQPIRQPISSALEEGELSEGEFEDLYEPQAPANVSVPAAKQIIPPRILENHSGRAGGTDGSSIYNAESPRAKPAINSTSTSIPEAERDVTPIEQWAPANRERDRSGSYSPYLSPREIQRKLPVAKGAPRDARIASSQHPLPTSFETNSSSTQQTSIASFSNGLSRTGPVINNNMNTPSDTANGSAIAAPLSFQSPSEAKKKAQEAILGLWPLKVRYQDYIEEGIDESTVKSLFTDLGLDTSVPKPTSASISKTVRDSQVVPGAAESALKDSPRDQTAERLPPTNAIQPPVDGTNGSPTASKAIEVKTAAKTAAEERKDKIARKLAAKAQKPTSTVPPPAPAAPAINAVPATAAPAVTAVPAVPAAPTTPVAPTPPVVAAVAASPPVNGSSAKPKTRAETNALLQQKLARIKKAQAQAAADKVLASLNEVTDDISSAITAPNTSGNERGIGSPAKPTPTPLAPQAINRRSASTELRGPSKDGNIPGLFLSSLPTPQPLQTPNRNLKRPVASDFDNYSTRGEPKRTRTQETLIIDVSDDEDVEMEIGSPADEPATPTEVDDSSNRKTSLGAYPPLSDPTSRPQRSSPALSAAPTPPQGGSKLGMLHKRIEEAKLMIAKAEAKKAAQRAVQGNARRSSTLPPSQAQSPRVVAAEADTEALQVMRLPKVAEVKAQTLTMTAERRDRIASYELRLVDATLQEKQVKLKQIVAEAAQLELELQAGFNKRQKLAAEMEDFVLTPLGEVPDSDSQSPPITTITNGAAQSLEPIQRQLLDEQEIVSSQAWRASLINSQPPVDGTTVSRQASADKEPISGLQNPPTAPAKTNDADFHPPSPSSPQTDEPLRLSNEVNDFAQGDLTHPPAEKDGSLRNAPAEASEQQPEHDESMPDAAAEALEPQPEHGGSMPDAAAEPSEPQPQRPDVDSDEADIPMQTSAAELSQSDEDSYEPLPAQISNVHDAQVTDIENTEVKHVLPQHGCSPLTSSQVVDQIPDEPNPTSLPEEPVQPEPEKASGEDEQHSVLSSGDLMNYQSPLGYFRAYRFHPQFFEEVPGGLKSMTYSSRIDPMRPVCPDILAGDQCPRGHQCQYQHFENMVLPDAEIITQLGSADMFTGDTRTRFIEGLKQVLNELKRNKVKDFDRITKAIVKHRQGFLDDKTKLLHLDAGAS